MAAKQTSIPGTERPTINEIEEAADAYREVRNKRMKLTDKEADLQGALQKVLHKHESKLTDIDENGNPFYVLADGDERAVLMRSEEKAKVLKYKAPKVED